MKIFCTEYPLLKGERMGNSPEIGSVFLRGDSSINNSGKILSRPWWSEDLYALPLKVARVGKVGRGFEASCAGKYYEEVALGVGFADRDRFRKALEKGEDPSLSYNFDGALFLSSFCKKEDFPSSIPFVTLTGGRQDPGTLDIPSDDRLIGETLAMLSRCYLMKMGDLVTFPLADDFEPVVEDFRRLYEGSRGELMLDLGVRLFRSNFAG